MLRDTKDYQGARASEAGYFSLLLVVGVSLIATAVLTATATMATSTRDVRRRGNLTAARLAAGGVQVHIFLSHFSHLLTFRNIYYLSIPCNLQFSPLTHTVIALLHAGTGSWPAGSTVHPSILA